MGEIEAASRLIHAQRKELATIDAMLRLIDANVKPSAIKGIRRAARIEGFRQGDITRLTYAVLRDAKEPLSATEIASRIMERRPVEFVAEFVKKVRANLLRLTREGRVERSGGHKARLWQLAIRPTR